VVHLSLGLSHVSIWATPQAAIQILRPFTRLRSVQLQNYSGVPSSFLPAAIHNLFQFSPDLEQVGIWTLPGPCRSFEDPNAPASSLFNRNKTDCPVRLRSLRIDGARYIVDGALASHLDLQCLQQLAFPYPATLDDHMVDEDFWLVLGEAARNGRGFGLKQLYPPPVSVGLVRFLSSFSTLEELRFASGFYPHPSFFCGEDPEPGFPEYVRDFTTAERRVVGEFFKTALPMHKDNLKFLALCGVRALGEAWDLDQEYLESVFQCRKLVHLHMPVCYPVDYLVSGGRGLISICFPG